MSYETSRQSRASLVKQGGKFVLASVLVLAACACAAGSTDAQQAMDGGGVGSFLLGFWHGIIAPLTLIVELINAFASEALPWSPRMYQEGAGVIYDAGFFLGMVGGPSILWTGSLRRR